MKIIELINTLNLAGAERMCATLTLELQQKGHEVVVVSMFSFKTSISRELEKNGIKVIFLNKKPGFDLSIIGKMRKIFKEEKAEVIHTHLSSLPYAFFASRGLKIKRKIHTVHSMASRECGKWAKKLNYFFYQKNMVCPVALNETVKQSIAMQYKLKNQEIPVVFNGVNLKKCNVKETYEIKNDITILHIGRFEDVKNHKGLIEAFGIFQKKYPNSRLQLIGNGSLREDIKALTIEKALNEK